MQCEIVIAVVIIALCVVVIDAEPRNAVVNQ